MKVTLVSYTQNAIDLLIFAKSTRLKMSPSLMDNIKAMDIDEKIKELQYMANTVPSSWEFVDYAFMIEGVTRAFTHQLVRTRTGSYAQQAMRILPMGEYDFIYTGGSGDNPEAKKIFDDINDQIRSSYVKLTDLGVKNEDARGILPTNISTNILAKFNLRSLADLIKHRIGGRSQSEYRSVVEGMISEVLKVHPWAEMFIMPKNNDYLAQIDQFALSELSDEKARELMKIVDKLREQS